VTTEGSSRRAKRRQRLIFGGVGVAAVALVAGLAVLLFASGDDTDRAGTLTGGAATTDGRISGGGAQALIEMLGIQMPSKATAGNFSVAPGFTIDSMTVERANDGTISGTALVTVGGSGLQLGMNVSFKDKDNWSFTANAAAAPVFSPTSGISIDPTGITGSITKAGGPVTWSLVGSNITWTVSPGAVLTTQFSISNTCPLSDPVKCPENAPQYAYLGMPAASLKVDGFANTMTMAGGLDLSGTWARLEGSVGNLSFEGNGITNTQLVLWKGARRDSFDSSMVMPDLSSLNGGANFEFCGTFTISIPKVTNKSTSGCARWSKQGIVLAQSGGGTTVVTSVPTTDVSGASVSAPAGAEVKGLAWTNLPNAASFEIAFGGVKTALANRTWSLAGLGNLPGVAAQAMGIDLKGAQSLLFEVRGTFSATEISISGDIPVTIKIGTEPFKLDVKTIRATLAAGASSGFSFAIGTSTDVTLGYAPNTRPITSSLSLVAATKPAVGMVLSLNATGTKNSADAGVTGVTPASRLTRPDLATYIWPDQFGIKGMNLFNLAAEVGWTGGSPVVSYSSTTYLNPQGGDIGKVLQCNGSCDPTDWMVSTLAVSVSLTNPCFAYGFDGSAGGSTLAIDGGVMRTSIFKVGVAPTGCKIQSGGSTQSLPAAFVGFQFSAKFGNTTFDIATQTSADGFIFRTSVTNFSLAGLNYPRIDFLMKIDATGSQVSFSGQMVSDLGNADVTSDFVGNASGISQTLGASVTDWKMGRAGTMEVPQFTFSTSFSIPFDGGCADFSAAASGQMKVKKKTYNLKDASFRLTCNGLQSLSIAIDMEHVKHGGGSIFQEFRLAYANSNGTRTLAGGTKFEYGRRGTWTLAGSKFSRGITITIYVNFSLSVGNENAADFAFGGGFDADRVSGSLGCSWTSDEMDFRCGGTLRLNPSWAGIYRKDWGDL
jgi:hypothetical protein